jgi:caa(3)-type oxidase subunit IV
MSHERDDVYEYSLDTHHDEATGKKVRQKIYLVLFVLSAITILEVGLGFKFSRVEGMKETLKWIFIVLTLAKAAGIVLYFMHLGDEKKTFRQIILGSYGVLVAYLIYICLVEASYNGSNKSGIETNYKALNEATPAPAHGHGEAHGGEHATENHEGGEHH